MLTEILTTIGYSPVQWSGIIISALLIGISRTAISGLAIIAIPLLAGLFGGRVSTGIILPMLVVADTYAIYHYRRNAHRPTITNILPWALAGLVLGVSVGAYIDDRHFKLTIGLIVLVCILIMLYSSHSSGDTKLPHLLPAFVRDTWILHALIGIAGGFASMIGNAAGPIFWIYLISRNPGKSTFMGTSAWLFFVMNMTKLPLQILVWQNITLSNLTPSILMVPVVLAGTYAGTIIIKYINEKPFKYLVLGMSILASLDLIFR
jgi:uncharacterized membrane protein YfcA